MRYFLVIHAFWLGVICFLGCSEESGDQAEGALQPYVLISPADSIAANETFGNGERFRIKYGKSRMVVDLDSAIFYYREALGYYQKGYEGIYKDEGKCHNNLGTVYQLKQAYPLAVNSFVNALEIWKMDTTSSADNLPLLYNNLGSLHFELREYEDAIRFFEEGIRLNPDNLITQYRLNRGLGAVMIKMGELNKGIKQLKLASSAIQKLAEIKPEYLPTLGNSINDIGASFQDNDLHDSARVYAEQALSLLKENNIEYSNAHFSIYNTLGGSYRGLKQYQQALDFFKKAEDMGRKIYGEKNPYMATIFNNIGYTYHHAFKDYEKAIFQFQKALSILIPSYSEKPVDSLPDIKFAYNYRTLVSLKGKATSLHKLYLKTNIQTHLVNALNHFDLAEETIISLRKNFTTEQDKAVLAKETTPIYEDAIRVAYRLFKNTNDSIYLRKAYRYIQANKSLSLFEALQDRYGRAFAGIPEELIKEEEKLRASLFTAQRNYRSAKIGNRGATDLSSSQQEIIEYNIAYRDFVDQLERSVPAYHALKYGMKLASVTEIQKNILQPSNVLLDYFVGDSSLFIFFIEEDDFGMKYFPINSSLNQKIQGFRSSLDIIHGNSQQKQKTYLELGRKLYLQLIEPFDSQIQDKNLIIIPDDFLHHLPFEALLTETVEKASVEYRLLPYLIREHQVSYGHSASLLNFNKLHPNSKTPSKTLIAFVPDFGDDAKTTYRRFAQKHGIKPDLNYLDSLQESLPTLDLANAARKIFNGDLCHKQKATKEAFHQKVKEYAIVHIGSHAKLDDLDPSYSYIAFSKNLSSIDRDNGYLRTYEIYNLETRAELVVLTACETGLGKIARGEGAISLARGFSFAGTPSILMSLWKIEDLSTESLVMDFYTGIKEGQGKDEALQEAKLKMIGGQFKSHPYFWSGIVLVGDNSPLKFPIR